MGCVHLIKDQPHFVEVLPVQHCAEMIVELFCMRISLLRRENLQSLHLLKKPLSPPVLLSSGGRKQQLPCFWVVEFIRVNVTMQQIPEQVIIASLSKGHDGFAVKFGGNGNPQLLKLGEAV
ncbi:hypothetical protein NW754_008422 [Fusarium falciforme]|nr:hypothetical protein NW754_008422 [Fusarium falciforme]